MRDVVAPRSTPTSLGGGESSASGAQARRSEPVESGQTPVAGNVTPTREGLRSRPPGSLGAALPEKLLVRVERTEYVEIEVDVAGLIAEWADASVEPWEREDIIEVLHKIGVRDLMYSGDFIKVLETDTEESIQ